MRKSQSTESHRPVLALVLLAAAVFLAFGDRGGALGQHLVRLAGHYIGQLGIVLTILTLVFSAYVLGAPTGTAAKVAGSIRARRQASPAPSRILVEKVRLSESPVLDRRKADDVRSAMKSLGYLKHEYDPVLAGLDMSMPIDKLVRTAICVLHKRSLAS